MKCCNHEQQSLSVLQQVLQQQQSLTAGRVAASMKMQQQYRAVTRGDACRSGGKGEPLAMEADAEAEDDPEERTEVTNTNALK